MKISKRLLFFVCAVFVSESAAMKKELSFKKIDLVLEEQLKPVFAQFLRINPDSEEIGRIFDYGPLYSNMPGNASNIRLLLNNNDTPEYVEKIVAGANKAHIYQGAVILKAENRKLRDYTIIDFRSLDTEILEKIKKETDPFKTEIDSLRTKNESLHTQIEALNKQNTAFEDKWKNRSIIEKHPYIFCGLGILAGGLLVAFSLNMQQGRLEPMLLKN